MSVDQTSVIEVPTQALYELLTNVLDGNYARNIGEMRVIYNLTQKGLSKDTDALTKLVSAYERAFKQRKLMDQYSEMGISEHLHQVELSTTKTAANTYRVLINGNVHPKMVGYKSVYEALCLSRKVIRDYLFGEVLPVFSDDESVRPAKLIDIIKYSPKYRNSNFSTVSFNLLVDLNVWVKDDSGIDIGQDGVSATNYFDNILDEQLTQDEKEELAEIILLPDWENSRLCSSPVYLRKLRQSDLRTPNGVKENGD